MMQGAVLLQGFRGQVDPPIERVIPRGEIARQREYKNEREMHAPDNQYEWQICLHNFFGNKIG
jgi:hypothetical protein